MSLYKVMLVDDEKDVMDVIMQKINWQELSLEKPVYAANGIEALEMAEIDKPDIVLTDIKMPYMDGLQLAHALKELDPNIRIIILSGFDEFEYAKQAISLNCEEYLLKPIDAKRLQDVFVRIKTNLDKELNERQDRDMLRHYYQESLPLLRDIFFTSLVQGHIASQDIPRYLNDYQIDLHAPFYAVCLFHTSGLKQDNSLDHMLQVLSVQKLANEKISPSWKPYFFNCLSNLCAIIRLDKESDIRQFTDDMDRFSRLCQSMLKATVTCGIGQVVNCLADLNTSYNGARQAVSYRVLYGSSKAINIVEIAPKEKEENSEQAENALREIFKRIKLEDPIALEEAISAYLKSYMPHSSLMQHNLFVMDLVGQMARFVKNNELDAQSIFGNDDLGFSQIQNSDPDNFKAWLLDACKNMQKSLQENRSSSSKDFVKKAKEYVMEHYSDPQLSLNMLCHELGVSGCYFSTVFRKETDQTFVSFLTDVRMNKAADMLVSQDEKAYIVANKVGYNDPNYFSYVFRRKFGVSPSKYKGGK